MGYSAGRRNHAALATLCCAVWMSVGLPFVARAQSPAGPSSMVAAISLNPDGPAAPTASILPVSTVPSTPGRLASGFVPPECRALQASDSPRLVDCWLARFPRIASAVRWEFLGRGGLQVMSWPEWDEASRQAVRDGFVAARAWHASGRKNWPGAAFVDPPVNLEAPFLNEESVATVLDRDTAAWPLFTAQVGLSLAAEIHGWVPWSLRSYDTEALQDLFDAPRRMFTYDRNDGGPNDTVTAGYSPIGHVTPAHPTTTFSFLADHQLIAATPLDTITKVLEWSRRRMLRTVRFTRPGATELPLPQHEAFWQYRGKAPLGRILAGTRLDRGDAALRAQYPDSVSWTSGCAMTSDVFAWLLRAANIPVRRVEPPVTCGHATPFFSGEGLYLSHADDPYDSMTKSASFSAQLLLVRRPLWQAWFPPGEPWCWNVGRRVVDLNLRFPSDYLVDLHCADVLAGLSRDESRVQAAFRNLYTQEQLERAALWERLGARAETSTSESCRRLRGAR